MYLLISSLSSLSSKSEFNRTGKKRIRLGLVTSWLFLTKTRGGTGGKGSRLRLGMDRFGCPLCEAGQERGSQRRRKGVLRFFSWRVSFVFPLSLSWSDGKLWIHPIVKQRLPGPIGTLFLLLFSTCFFLLWFWVSLTLDFFFFCLLLQRGLGNVVMKATNLGSRSRLLNLLILSPIYELVLSLMLPFLRDLACGGL